MAPIIGIGIGINRQYRVVSGGGGGGPARTLGSVSVGAFSAGTYSVTLTGDAADGEDVIWVLYSGTDPTLATEVAAGTWSGATVVDDGTFLWAASPAPITLVDGIAKANYKLVCIVDNGALSNLVISSAFEVDTTDSLLTAESFTDDSTEGVNWAFTSNENVSYRVSLWADGSTPSAAAIESGTGSVATVTGTAAATVAETGNFAAVGDGIYVPTIWVSDDYLNEYTETYADVTVAAAVSDPLAADAGRIYRYEIGTMTRSGSDVITAPDGGLSPVDLTTTPGAFDAPTQASGTAPIVFNAAASPGPTVIQSPTNVAGNRKIGQHLRGGGSNAIRVFIACDASTFSTTPAAFFSENLPTNELNLCSFGAYASLGNVRFYGRVANNAANAVDILTSTSDPIGTVGKCIIEFHITQTTWQVFIDGVSKGTGTTTAANFPNPTTSRVSLGAIADTTSHARPATGSVYEIFITGTADSTFASTVRSYLTTKHGL